MSTELLRKAAADIRADYTGAVDAAFEHAVADWLTAAADEHDYFHLARANCREADQSGDCGCAYKDCYEHGKWHNCSHGEPDLFNAQEVARTYVEAVA